MEKVVVTKQPGRFPYLSWITFALSIIFAFAISSLNSTGQFAAAGIGCFIFLASSAVGGAFGFLFAVPRLLSAGPVQNPDPPANGAKETSSSTQLLQSNTNLERISDWLTTMLVGVGLSQVGSINQALLGFHNFIAENARVFPDAKGGFSPGSLPAVAPMILIFGVVTGFLALYLYTRIILTGSFHRVERDLSSSELQRVTVSGHAGTALINQAKTLVQSTKDSTMRRIAGSKRPSVGDGLDVMLKLLYEADGYRGVIGLAAQLSQSPLAKTGEYWFYLAAAFGQQYHALLEKGATKEELDSSRDNALDAARRAVEIDRAFIERLWGISDPNSFDNDLGDFREDAEFRKIVRRPLKG